MNKLNTTQIIAIVLCLFFISIGYISDGISLFFAVISGLVVYWEHEIKKYNIKDFDSDIASPGDIL